MSQSGDSYDDHEGIDAGSNEDYGYDEHRDKGHSYQGYSDAESDAKSQQIEAPRHGKGLSGRDFGHATQAAESIYSVVAKGDVQRMGWAPTAWPPSAVFVGSITSSWASRRSIGVGDELIAIDGRKTTDLTKADFIALLNKRPLRMTFKRQAYELDDDDVVEGDWHDVHPDRKTAAKSVVQVFVIGAETLQPVGDSDTCSPFCICQVSSRPNISFQTRVSDQTCDPQWNHKKIIHGVDARDDLEFHIWDKTRDAMGHSDLVGYAELPGAMYFPGGFQGHLDLEGGGMLHLEVSVLESGAEVKQSGIRVKIISAKGLKSADADRRFKGGKAWGHKLERDAVGQTDPYCICQVAGKRSMKFKTRAIENSRNPVWEEEHEFTGIAAGDELEFVVWDADDDDRVLLGFCELAAAQFWPDGFFGTLALEGGGSLQVSIDVIGQPPPEYAPKIPDNAWSLVANRGVKRLGWAPGEMPPRPIVVEGIEAMSWAASQGLREGDELVGIDGKLVTRMSKKEFIDAMRPRPLRMAFVRPPGNGPIKVTIVEAKGLRKADIIGSSDPFCVCEVQGKDGVGFETPTVIDTVEPYWNHSQELHECFAFDFLTFKVYDSDVLRNDNLGHAKLAPSQYRPDGFDGELLLEDAGKNTVAFLHVKVEMLRDPFANGPPPSDTVFEVLVKNTVRRMGWTPAAFPPEAVVIQEVTAASWADKEGIKVSDELTKIDGDVVKDMSQAKFIKMLKDRPILLSFLRKIGNRSVGNLRIKIVRASGLPKRDSVTQSDPYCYCEVLGKEAAFQTPIVNNNSNPKWNHTHELKDCSGVDFLVFWVYDSDYGRDDVLGVARLPRFKFWPDGYKGELTLEQDGKATQATIEVFIEVFDDLDVVSGKPQSHLIELVVSEFVEDMGWQPSGRPPAQIFVDAVEAASWAYKAGVLVGDELMQVKGTPVGEMTALAFKNVLNERPLKLTFLRSGSKPTPKDQGKKHSTKVVTLTVIRADNLRKADIASPPDPYCICEILGSPENKFLSPICDNSKNPVWNWMQDFAECRESETIRISIYDKDYLKKKGDFLGHADIPLSDFWTEGSFEGDLALVDAGHGKKATVTIKAQVNNDYQSRFKLMVKAGVDRLGWTPVGEPPDAIVVSDVKLGGWGHIEGLKDGDVLLEIDDRVARKMSEAEFSEAMRPRPLYLTFGRPFPEEEEQKDGEWEEETLWLVVSIVNARNLRSADWGGASDPYCVCQLPGDADIKEVRFETPVISETLNPEWNHKQTLPEVRMGLPIHFSIYDKDIGGEDLLGNVTLDYEQYYPDGFEGDVVLENSKKGQMATLRLKIDVLKRDMVEEFEENEEVERSWEAMEKQAADELFGRGKEGDFEVVVDETITSMGWGPTAMPPERVLVREIHKGSWAEQRGLRLGDELISVESRKVSDISKKHLQRVFRLRPLRLRFHRCRKTAHEMWETGERSEDFDHSILNLSEGVFELSAEKGVEGLGWVPSAMPPEKVFVHSVKAKTWAHKKGLKRGDELVELDGIRPEMMSPDQLQNTIKFRPLTMVFCRRAEPEEPQHQSAEHLLEVVLGINSRLGFMPSGVPPKRVWAQKIEPGSVAEACGVREGDELVQINGKKVLDMTPEQFMEELPRRPTRLQFELCGKTAERVTSRRKRAYEREDGDDAEDQDEDDEEEDEEIEGPFYDEVRKLSDAEIRRSLSNVLIGFGGKDRFAVTDVVNVEHIKNTAFATDEKIKRCCTIEYAENNDVDGVLKIFTANDRVNLFGYEFVGAIHAMDAGSRTIDIGMENGPFYLGLEIQRDLNQRVFDGANPKQMRLAVQGIANEIAKISEKNTIQRLPEKTDFIISFATRDPDTNNALLRYLSDTGVKSGPWGVYENRVSMCTDWSVGIGVHFGDRVHLCYGRLDLGLPPVGGDEWFWEFAKASRRTNYGVLILDVAPKSSSRNRVRQLSSIDENRQYVFDTREKRIVTLTQYYRTETKHGPAAATAILHGDMDKLFDVIWEDPSAVQAADAAGKTPLHVAATRGDAALAGWILRARAFVNAKDGLNATPLYFAASEGHEDVARLLLDAQADTETRSHSGHTAFSIAALRNHSGCAAMLRNMQDPHNFGGTAREATLRNQSLAVQAVLQGNVQLVAEALSQEQRWMRGADSQGKSLLHHAASCGHIQVAKYLLEAGLNVNGRDQQLFTPLHSAASFGNEKMVRLLLVRQADVESRDLKGYTALDCALLEAQEHLKRRAAAGSYSLSTTSKAAGNFKEVLGHLRAAGTPEYGARQRRKIEV